MRNQDVIRSFAWGKRAAAGNLQTDGRSLWSYNLKIAKHIRSCSLSFSPSFSPIHDSEEVSDG